MNQFKRCFLRLLALFMFIAPVSRANNNRGNAKTGIEQVVAKIAEASAANEKTLKRTWEKTGEGTVSIHTGLFTIYQTGEKYYFAIADSILGRDILISSRLSKSGVDMRSVSSMAGNRGDLLNSTIVRFEKGAQGRIFMREISYSERVADSTQSIFKAVQNSNIQPIVLTFKMIENHFDSAANKPAIVIDMTDIINSDNDLFYFGKSKTAFNLGGFQADKSYPLSVRSFPTNTEIRTIKTYSKTGGAATPDNAGYNVSGMATIELVTSLILLPKAPMRTRYADPRIGYFSNSYIDFDSDDQSINKRSIITRWRLEPRPQDMEKYKKGELVHPQKPIVIYIDPATPKQWVPYLIQGINDWNVAFEKAGFKNAIIGKTAPTAKEDSTWNIEDESHSALIYKPSLVSNASGTRVVDPRSGEILETRINWYHNIAKLLHDWYFVQCAAVDARARKPQFDQELMGRLIRAACAHEVGHALGLRHNFGSSSTVPTDSLRNERWLKDNGLANSIMDYARYNYVAQPGDQVSQTELLPHLGPYDKWAIEWGYRLIPDAHAPNRESTVLNKWVNAHADKKYWFGVEDDLDDPRSQSEDLGDNAAVAGSYGIKNLKFITQHLKGWTTEQLNEPNYNDLKEMYHQVIYQYLRYINHAAKNIGGRYETISTPLRAKAIYQPVPYAVQKQNTKFIIDQALTTPYWIVDPTILSFTGDSPLKIIGDIQLIALNHLVNSTTLSNLMAGRAEDSTTYQPSDLIDALQTKIWFELKSGAAIDVYQRNLQQAYVDKLIAVATRPPAAPATSAITFAANAQGSRNIYPEVISLSRGALRDILKRINIANRFYGEGIVKDHLQAISDEITAALKV